MFTRRIRLFSLFGFDVWVDASWLLLAALISWTLAVAVFPEIAPNLAPGTYWWMAAVATIGLLLSIVLHEASHSLVARRYGISIRGITLFIFGGVAEMDSEPPSPKGELLMAAAGPAASFVIAAALFVAVAAAGALNAPDSILATLWYLGFINGVLALFNLVPAFPLDGGRILRAALWMWRGDLLWGTRIAAGAGDLFGIVLIVLGVLDVMAGDFVSGMWRFLIGVFIRGAAAASYQETMARTAFAGVPVLGVMTPSPIAVPPDTSVADFVEHFVYRHHHRTFPVTQQGLLVGSVGTEEAAKVDRSAWPTTPVAEIVAPCQPDDVVEPQADALAALGRMRRGGRSRLWVVDDGRLVGVLSLRDMLELLSAKLELGATEDQTEARKSGPSSRRRAA